MYIIWSHNKYIFYLPEINSPAGGWWELDVVVGLWFGGMPFSGDGGDKGFFIPGLPARPPGSSLAISGSWLLPLSCSSHWDQGSPAQQSMVVSCRVVVLWWSTMDDWMSMMLPSLSVWYGTYGSTSRAGDSWNGGGREQLRWLIHSVSMDERKEEWTTREEKQDRQILKFTFLAIASFLGTCRTQISKGFRQSSLVVESIFSVT